MKERSILGKSAALTCSLALLSAYVYQRAGGEFLISVRKPEARANSVKRAPRRDSVSIWAPDWPSYDGLSPFAWNSDWRKRLRRHNLVGSKSAPVFHVDLEIEPEDVTIVNADGTTTTVRLNGSSAINASGLPPSLGLPNIPATSLPQQLDVRPQP